MPTLYWLQMASIHSTKPFNVVNLACDVAQLQLASLIEHEEFSCVTCFANSWKIISYIKSI
jgi:hypothetical protein